MTKEQRSAIYALVAAIVDAGLGRLWLLASQPYAP